MIYKDIILTWRGDVTSYSTSAQYARAILKPLIDGGASVRLELTQPVRPEAELDWWPSMFPILTKATASSTIVTCGSLDSTVIKTGEKAIAITGWNTKEIPSVWNDFISRANFSSMVAMSPIEKLPKNMAPINYPIDIDSLNRITPLKIAGIDDNTVLLGGIGEWNNKNNFSDVLVAFLKAFTDKDNVALVLKTFCNNIHDLNQRKAMIGLIKKIKKDTKKKHLPKVILLQEIMSYNTIDALLKRINIYVSSSRGKHLDISMLKSFAMGKQIIGPAHTFSKYLSTIDCGNVYLTPTVYEPVMLDSTSYSVFDAWGRADCETLATDMRRAVHDYIIENQKVKEIGKKNKAHIRQDFNTDTEVNKFADIIRKNTLVPVTVL